MPTYFYDIWQKYINLIFVNMGNVQRLVCSNGYSNNDIHIDFVEISQYFYAFRSIIIFYAS